MKRKTARKIVKKLKDRVYVLAHGEYHKPDYYVRKKRGVDYYQIMVRYYFYLDAMFPKQNGVLALGLGRPKTKNKETK